MFVGSGQGGTEVDTSAGTLSEAKTQRRPHRARERVRGGDFLCCFVVFVSFFEQGKKKTRRGDGHGEGGRKGEARRWFKKGCSVTVWEPSGDSAGHVGG